MIRKTLLLLFLFTFFLFFTSPLFAQTEKEQDASPAAKKTVDYTLPYPGLLPDSPFYVFKMARDRIVSYLISDPLKKAEFNLLQSEKRFQAGVYLLNKDHAKANLALSTISKGQNYFTEALGNIDQARKQGFSSEEVTRELLLSSQKQYEMLRVISPVVPTGEQGYYREIVVRAQELIFMANQKQRKDKK